MTSLQEKLALNSQAVQREISKILEGSEASLEPMRYSAIAEGKCIRSFIFLEILQSLGIDSSKHLDLAAAVEIFHTYSLIHDDLPAMDDSCLRRGKKTLHLEYSDAVAVLSGDALLTLAFEIISSTTNVDKDIALELVRELATCGGYKGMVEGQYLDIRSQNNKITLDEIKKIHLLKTGRLFQFCSKAPCLITSSYQLIPAMEKLAYSFGMLFQITDDIIDSLSSSDVTGKDQSKDADLNKPNFVSLLGIKDSKALCKDYQNKALLIIKDSLDSNQHLLDLVNFISNRKN